MSKEHVHDVFGSIAQQYDAANNRISLGMHHLWKNALVEQAVAAASKREIGVILDVCCGTGDITERIARKHPNMLVVGLDFSADMLNVARARTSDLHNVMLVEGNAMSLPFDDETFDAAVISFGLRNTPDYAQVINEMARVTRSDGIVACLDASVPDSQLIEPFYKLYYKYIMTFLGGGISKHREYEWLYQSTQDFLRKNQLERLFYAQGLHFVRVYSFMLGAAAMHTGIVLH